MAADLWTDAQAVLDAVVSELSDPPARRYVADGEPAFDECEQLTIHLGGMRLGAPPVERPSMPCAPNTVTMVLTRTWCVPVGDGDPPRLTELVASGKIVVNGALELLEAARVAATQVACQPTIEDAAPIEPSGGYVGWTVVLSWIPRLEST